MEYPKLANYTTIGIIAVVVIIEFWAFDVYEGNWNNPHTIYPQPIKKSFYNATLTVSSENEIISKEEFARDIVIRTALHITSLSAQNPYMLQQFQTLLINFQILNILNYLILLFYVSLIH